MSMYLDDWPHISAFSYRMKGFLNHTCHHYYKHYQLRLWELVSKRYLSRKSKYDDFCIGAKKRHKALLDLLFKFKHEYNLFSNNFAIMHYVENSHDTNKRFNWVDNDLHAFLKDGFSEGIFNNTAIFLYSDHGTRFADKRESADRYLEERLPFFSIYLPQSYREANPDKYENLKINAKYLTSPFDIHATLRDLTCLDPNPSGLKYPIRSISLLKEIPKERGCEQIGISNHFCVCVQDWLTVDKKEPKIIDAANYIVGTINKLTAASRSLCANLYLMDILSAEKYMKNGSELIRIQFITMPNRGVYESVLIDSLIETYEFPSKKFSISSRNDISRIDSYGEQPSCLRRKVSLEPNQLLDLRKFCFCNRIIRKLTKN